MEGWQDRFGLFDAVADGIIAVDSEMRVVWINQTCKVKVGDRHPEWIGKTLLDIVDPADHPTVLARIGSLSNVPMEIRVVTPEGRAFPVEALAQYADPALGLGPGGLVVVARDLERRHLLDVDNGNVALLRSLIHYASVMIALISPEGRVRSINGAFIRELGYSHAGVLGSDYTQWIVEEDRTRVVQAVAAGLASDGRVTVDALMRHAEGHDVLVEFTVVDRSDDPTVGGLIVSGQIATSLRAARQRAEFLAAHDPATGLLNRTGFFDAASVLEHHATRTGEPLGVVMIDLDRLSQINELFGTAVGDAVILACAARLETIVRAEDLVARYDGDEFVIATTGPMDGLLAMRERVAAALREPIVVDGFELRVTASVAVAGGHPPVTILQLVDQAVVEADHAYRCSVGQFGGSPNALSDRRVLVDQLQLAVERHELRVWYQPIVDGSARLCGFEGLLRWEHPTRGVLAPGTFLPLISMAGLAEWVDEIVVEQSLAFITRLDALAADHLVVHINVSPSQLARPTFAGEVRAAREAHGVAPERFCVEITESDVLRINTVALDNLGELRRAGTHIAIDDFGTGFSSLAHLLELPVDMLKIDRRFVDGLGLDPMATSLTTAIVGLTKSVGFNCVAEGVETPEQRDRLVELGCPQLQGWLFDPALRPDDALGLLSQPAAR